ncbi:MAG: GntR family transcriptional regulator [Oscillospiraceae bacterium]|nr:GntR family transcriptional regulator [Oscillospiraceae bacterium]
MLPIPIVLDKSKAIPAYYQITKQLQDLIARGTWLPGDMIPSERDFCRELDINRATIRQAINTLVGDGILYRKKGIGTFVAKPKPKMNQLLSRMTNFTDYVISQGMVPGNIMIEREIVPAPLEVSKALECEMGDAVIKVHRLRLADDLPMVVECAYLNLMKCQAVLQADLVHDSLYNTLREKCGLQLSHCHETIEISLCDLEISKHLGIPVNSPIFLLKRTTFAEAGVVEYVISQSRPDRHKFIIELGL